jgi:hypothetical protein
MCRDERPSDEIPVRRRKKPNSQRASEGWNLGRSSCLWNPKEFLEQIPEILVVDFVVELHLLRFHVGAE